MIDVGMTLDLRPDYPTEQYINIGIGSNFGLIGVRPTAGLTLVLHD